MKAGGMQFKVFHVYILAHLMAIPVITAKGERCLSGPCVHGLCLEQGESYIDELDLVSEQQATDYRCFCENGYTGYNCEVDHNECSSNPCRNHAQCVDGVAKFTCLCLPGFKGSICDENVNECLSDPCQNNGTCEDGIDSYKCRCKPGYSGGNCEMDISVCNMTNLVLSGESVMRCLNSGECVDGPGYDYSCICTEGFRGKNCEEDIDECEVLPCNNGGLCVNLINDFQCFCPSGWTGKRCNEQLQFCGMFFNPCQHGGKCIILKPQNPIGNYSARNANGMSIKPKAEEFKITHPADFESINFICYCVPDYYGIFCENRYDNCIPYPKCRADEQCVDGVNSHCCLREGDITDNCTEVGNCDTRSLCPTSPLVSTTYNEKTTHILTPRSYSVPETESVHTLFSTNSWSKGLTSELESSSKTITTATTSVLSTFTEISTEINFPTSYSHTEHISDQFTMSPTDTEVSYPTTLSIDETPKPSLSILPTPTLNSTTQPEFSSVSTQIIRTSSIALNETFSLDSSTKIFNESFGRESTLFTTGNTFTNFSVFPSRTIRDSSSSSTPLFTYGHTSITISPDPPVKSDLNTLEISPNTQFTDSMTSFRTISMSETGDIESFTKTSAPSSIHIQSTFEFSTGTAGTNLYTASPGTSDGITPFPPYSFSKSETYSSPSTPFVHSPTSDSLSPTSLEIISTNVYASTNQTSVDISSDPYETYLPNVSTISPSITVTTEQSLMSPLQPSVGSTLNSFASSENASSHPTPQKTTEMHSTNVHPSERTFNPYSSKVLESNLPSFLPSSSSLSSTSTSAIKSVITSEPSFYRTSEIESSISSLIESIDMGSTVLPNSQSSTYDSGILLSETFTTGTTPSVVDQSKETTMYEISTNFIPTSIEPNFTISTLSSIQPTTTVNPTPVSDTCNDFLCANGGKCIVAALQGARIYKCDCPIFFSGPRCEDEVNIQIPYFVRSSFILHSISQVSKGPVLNIEVNFHSESQDGILMTITSEDGEVYLLLELVNNSLALTFSCGGEQRTSFIDSDKIQTGASANAIITFTMNGIEGYCSTSLLVDNSSIPMTGTQKTDKPTHMLTKMFIGDPSQHSNIYRSILSRKKSSELKDHGFIGCIYNIMINGEDLETFTKAVNGYNILECGKDLCRSSNPCYNNGTCSREGKNWYCDCQLGYDGTFCERITCQKAPCLNGGVCLNTTKGIGFTCLCPYGFKGINCEIELQVTVPFYHVVQNGYSSYTSYARPPKIAQYLEVMIEFRTSIDNQNSLIFYIGPEEAVGFTEDYFAIGIIEGYLSLQYNVGSGSVLLKSKTHLSLNSSITAYVGRHFRYGWISIDDNNVTGTSPGQMNLFSAVSDVFVGGHHSYYHSLIPSLPFHEGFQGCISEVKTRNGPSSSFSSLGKVEYGRSIENCQHNKCHPGACLNSGNCVKNEISYRCDCTSGWISPDCSVREDLFCTNECLNGGKCVQRAIEGNLTAECDCNFGFKGKNCEISTTIFQPFFNGKNTYLNLKPNSFIRHFFEIIIEFSSDDLDGLLFYTAQRLQETSGDFISLSLNNGTIEFRYNLGTSPSSTTTISSQTTVQKGQSVRLKAGRKEGKGYIFVNETLSSFGVSPIQMVSLDGTASFYLGGVPDLSTVNKWAIAKNPKSFRGCIKQLTINSHQYDFAKETLSGRNIDDCSDKPCGTNVCQNEGTCLNRANDSSTCQCTQDWYGENCLISKLCADNKCSQNTTCIPLLGPVTLTKPTEMYICDCKLGHSGKYCQEIETLFNRSLNFNGISSFLQIQNTTEDLTNLDESSVGFKFKTTLEDCILMWTGEIYDGEDYLGVGLRDGHLHVTWNLGGLDRNDILTESIFNDELWHSLLILRKKQWFTIVIDDLIYKASSTERYVQLNTKGIYSFGGFERKNSIEVQSNGYFKSSFKGCIMDINFHGIQVLFNNDTDLIIGGLNIITCGVT